MCTAAAMPEFYGAIGAAAEELSIARDEIANQEAIEALGLALSRGASYVRDADDLSLIELGELDEAIAGAQALELRSLGNGLSLGGASLGITSQMLLRSMPPLDDCSDLAHMTIARIWHV